MILLFIIFVSKEGWGKKKEFEYKFHAPLSAVIHDGHPEIEDLLILARRELEPVFQLFLSARRCPPTQLLNNEPRLWIN